MQFNLFWAVVAALACWRLTAIVHREKIFGWFRGIFGVKEIAEYTFTYPDNFFGKLLECFYCTSVWVAIFTVLIWWLCPYILLPFAVSTAAILIEELIT